MSKKIKIISVRSAAHIAGVCEETIRRAVRRGTLKSIKIENRILLSDWGLNEWMKKRGETISAKTLKQAEDELSKMHIKQV